MYKSCVYITNYFLSTRLIFNQIICARLSLNGFKYRPTLSVSDHYREFATAVNDSSLTSSRASAIRARHDYKRMLRCNARRVRGTHGTVSVEYRARNRTCIVSSGTKARERARNRPRRQRKPPDGWRSFRI